jgi:phospholipid/cholesterol/gamma-HCH transport system substrate-binding protein
METRARYLLVGSFVLMLLLALAGFGAWLAGSTVNERFDLYQVAFTGSVNGLQTGSAVRYRGVPIGRVTDIRIDPDNIANILVTLELRAGTPIKEDMIAVVEMQGITGIASVQLRGGLQQSANLVAKDADHLPRIRAGQSALEQVFDSTPQILARAALLLDRLNGLLDERNTAKLERILDDTVSIMDGFAAGQPQLAATVERLSSAAVKVSATADRYTALADDLQGLAKTAGAEVGGLGEQGRASLAAVTKAGESFQGLARRLDALVAANGQSVADFSQSGLYEFTQMTSEARQLIAVLSRISKEFERDPTGYILGGSQKGFTPK